MLNLIAGVLCIVESLFFTCVGGPVWIIIGSLLVGALNLVIWEHNR